MDKNVTLTAEETSAMLSILKKVGVSLGVVDSQPTPEVKQWPQVGDRYYYVASYSGDVLSERIIYHGCNVYEAFASIGNAFKTEAEALRRAEALQVQAELRGMPGRTPPPDDDGRKWFIRKGVFGFCADYFVNSTSVQFAIAGIWFSSNTFAENAITTIGQDRLQIWLDDYLQTPIGG